MIALTDLRADCGSCTALCCVLLPYSRAAGFGADKPGGIPCAHLLVDDRCGIHDQLREQGWPGCEVFDCFGAGQWVSGYTYAGRSWRDPEVDRGEMAAVLSAQRLVHEMLWHLDEVARRDAADETTRELQSRLLDVRALAPAALLRIDVDDLVEAASDHFARVRATKTPTARDLRRADLAGQDLRDEDLVDADLRGAALLGADLRGVDLGAASLLGADLRGARLESAVLDRVWFLTQPQIGAARGGEATLIPPRLRRPQPWLRP